jgi:hypothetical protein
MAVVEPLTPLFKTEWEEVKSRKCHHLLSKPTINTNYRGVCLYSSCHRTIHISFNVVFRNYTLVENKGLNNKVVVMGLQYL